MLSKSSKIPQVFEWMIDDCLKQIKACEDGVSKDPQQACTKCVLDFADLNLSFIFSIRSTLVQLI